MKVFIRIIAVLTLLLLAGCSAASIKSTEEPSAAPEENTDIIAIVNDDIILVDEVFDVADSYFSSMEMSSADYSSEELLELYNMILDDLINSMLEQQKAKELGYDELSAEDVARAEEELKTERSDRLEHFLEAVKEEYPAADEATLNEMAGTAVESYVEATGETDDYLLNMFAMNIAVENMKNELISEVAISEEELQVGYEQRVEEDEQTYAEHPDYFASDRTTNVLYYNLPGYRYVRHILVSDADKAQQLYERLGETEFETLMTEYSEDSGSESFEDGYAVCADCEIYDAEFVKAAMALERPGDVSAVVKTGDGYEIIKYVSDIPEGAVPIEEVKESLYDEMLYNKQQEYYGTLLDGWRDESFIKINEDIYGL